MLYGGLVRAAKAFYGREKADLTEAETTLAPSSLSLTLSLPTLNGSAAASLSQQRHPSKPILLGIYPRMYRSRLKSHDNSENVVVAWTYLSPTLYA
jgi:hypothetical protein